MQTDGSAIELSGVYHSPLGGIVLNSNGEALTGLRFAGEQTLLEDLDIQNNHVFETAYRWLGLYFSGCKPDFMPLLAPSGTLFQQSVWRLLLTIPYGQTVSYGDIAQRLHCRSAQAVGRAVGRNPVAIMIPCHRVVGANGSLTGYAYGLDRKQWLLSHEATNNHE